MSLFFFNDTATTEIYTLSLHDALPIFNSQLQPTAHTPSALLGAKWGEGNHVSGGLWATSPIQAPGFRAAPLEPINRDRKSTRLNSSHANISYAVFCLQKKDRRPVGPAA